MKTIVMELWGGWGHFRKFYTTSSPLTFSFPPPTAVAGIIGAILGFSRDDYLETLNTDNFDVAISLINPVRKTRMTLNHIETKSAIELSKIRKRTQIKTEFLRDARFRLYIYFKDSKLHEDVKNLITEHRCHYTLSLGLSELIANFGYVGEYELKPVKSEKETPVSSVVPVEVLGEDDITFDEGLRLVKERIPVHMKPDRSVDLYKTAIFDTTGKPIKIKSKSIWSTGDDRSIIFLGTLLSS